MVASASRSATCPAALPCWVKELLALVPETSTCVVSVSLGEFVVKVHPATPRHAPLQPDQQRKAHPPRRAQREGGEPQSRSMNAHRLRSAHRAEEHAARRRSRRLHLQRLLHRHVWRVRGWQRMQNVWKEWNRSAAVPLPPPAPPQTRPLQIVDPTALSPRCHWRRQRPPQALANVRSRTDPAPRPPPPSSPSASPLPHGRG